MGEGRAGAASAAESPLHGYARWAAGVSRRIDVTDRERLAYLALGLTGEAGEVADAVKRLFRDGALDADHVAEELGDVAYYWANLCTAIGRSPDDILAASRTKIEARLAGAAR